MEKVPNVQQLRYQTKGRETVPMQFANDLSRVLNEYAGKVDRLNGQELDKAREDVLIELQREFSEYGVPDDVRYTHPLFYINNIIEEKLSKLNK